MKFNHSMKMISKMQLIMNSKMMKRWTNIMIQSQKQKIKSKD